MPVIQSLDSHEGGGRKQGVVATVHACKLTHNPTLDLARLRLTTLPTDLALLMHLRCLDISENNLHGVDISAVLPVKLEELKITGCGLIALPEGLTRLTALKRLYASANRITDIASILKLTSLQHLSLSGNPISELPAAIEWQQCSSLLCLDLSYCNLEHLPTTSSALTSIPRLQSLYLAGNPLCLLPSYPTCITKASWNTRLLYLDGQRTEQNMGSRPNTSRGASAAHEAAHMAAAISSGLTTRRSGSAVTTAAATAIAAAGDDPGNSHTKHKGCYMELHLGALQILEDPFANARPALTQLSQPAVAQDGSPAVVDPLPQLQPVYYHFELDGFDGEPRKGSFDNAMVNLQPPTVQLTGQLVSQVCDELQDTAVLTASSEETGLETGVAGFPLDGHHKQGVDICQDLTVTDTIPAVYDQTTARLPNQATLLCCIPLKIEPPEPLQAGGDAATTPTAQPTPNTRGKVKEEKKPTKADKTAGKSGKPGSKPSTPLPGSLSDSAASVARGQLRAMLPITADTRTRDRLRAGLQVRLYRTTLHVVPQPVIETTQEVVDVPASPTKANKGAAAKPAAGKNKPGTPQEPVKVIDIPPPKIESTTHLIGEGYIKTAAFLSGMAGPSSKAVQVQIPLMACPRLWDEQGFRMAYKDPRHDTQPLAMLPVKLMLHATQPPVWYDQNAQVKP